MRRMGGLRNLLPFTFSLMLIGSLALMGFPFLSGFYSKDVILEAVWAVDKSCFNLTYKFRHIYFLGVLAAFCTSYYSIRLLYLTFLSTPNGFKPVLERMVHEPVGPMLLSYFLLVLPTVLFGF